MGLTRNNVNSGNPGKFFGLAQGALSRPMFNIIHNAGAFGQKTSVPQGFNDPHKAIRMTIKVGGNMKARAKGDVVFTADLKGSGNMAATFTGQGFFIANGNVATNGYATFLGEADFTAAITAIGFMSARMDILARPTAFDIAQEVWNSPGSGFLSAGTLGKKLSDAESAAKLGAALSA